MAALSVSGALTVILSMTSSRPLSRCNVSSIARKIQGCNNVRSAKLIFNALINSPQYSTLHVSLPKCSTIAMLSSYDLVARLATVKQHILINLLALHDKIERASSLHERLQLFAPLRKCYSNIAVDPPNITHRQITWRTHQPCNEERKIICHHPLHCGGLIPTSTAKLQQPLWHPWKHHICSVDNHTMHDSGGKEKSMWQMMEQVEDATTNHWQERQ